MEKKQEMQSESETCISEGADASPQLRQTNLYRWGNEEVALTLERKFVIDRWLAAYNSWSTLYHSDKQSVVFIDMLLHVKT